MNQVNLTQGIEQAWAAFTTFIPKLLLAVVILVVGYIIAKVLCRTLALVLHKVGFDRLVERGGVKRVLARSQYDASTFLARILFYCVMLLALQLAFGAFGPNPVSDILNRLVAYLPNVFVAALIVIVATGIAKAVKDLFQAAMAGLSYGSFLATLASILIIGVGIFAALNELNIAPAIVNGLFYAILAIIAGSAIVAIGGSGIGALRPQWAKLLTRLEQDAPQFLSRTRPPSGGSEESRRQPAPQRTLAE